MGSHTTLFTRYLNTRKLEIRAFSTIIIIGIDQQTRNASFSLAFWNFKLDALKKSKSKSSLGFLSNPDNGEIELSA